MLISSRQFCRLVDIGHDRFEQRRLRERAVADLAASLGDDDLAGMPIAPTELGQRCEYDAFDAVRLRAVIELERGGMAFGAACRFLRSAGLSPEIMFLSGTGTFAAQWLEPGGIVRRLCGDAHDLARAMPAAPIAAITINLCAVRDDVAKRAGALLCLSVVGTNFARNVQ